MSTRKIKVLAYVHGYLPNLPAGAENMLHQILLELKKMGHEVIVSTRNPGASEYDGIRIYEAGTKKDIKLARWCDVIISHLNQTVPAVRLSRQSAKPLVHLVHNDYELARWKINNKSKAALAIANSNWIMKSIPNKIPSIVVFPPTLPEQYSVKTSREAITMINISEGKNGKMFWDLAAKFPNKRFIGVKGGYGSPATYHKKLENVTILENTPDIQNVYAQARIVIMPSPYESWGRVAMEAACSGIPVIASPTPGLQESLSYSGIFAAHDSIEEWVKAVEFLDNKKNYEKYSRLTKQRSIEVAKQFAIQIQKLEEELLKLIV